MNISNGQSSLVCAIGDNGSQAQNATLQTSAGAVPQNLCMTLLKSIFPTGTFFSDLCWQAHNTFSEAGDGSQNGSETSGL